jgi:hypothetical protein
MTHTPSDDEGLREEIIDAIDNRRFDAGFPSLLYRDVEWLVDNALMALISQKIKDAKQQPVTIMGKTIDEVYLILCALELERITDIKVTMANLDKLYLKLSDDMQLANQKAIDAAVATFTTKQDIKEDK